MKPGHSIGQTESTKPASQMTRMKNASILVVGAGGIGCELLKNLVLVGVKSIEIVDLDTIDVSNLNRQLLFRREHVGLHKAVCAKAACQKLNKYVAIDAVVDRIQSEKFSVDHIRSFTAVVSALDNIAARRHVNRICVAAGVILIDVGTSGFYGNVQTIRKGVECYDCYPKQTPKNLPICTVRLVPYEPHHCVVWAKMLFNRLFSSSEDVNYLEEIDLDKYERNEDMGNRLFDSLFNQDICELRDGQEDDSIWNNGAPVPIKIESFIKKRSKTQVSDREAWNLNHCATIFLDAFNVLVSQPKTAFDKDNITHLQFVTSAANFRQEVFHIKRISMFETKAIAGSIVPAVATTNAIVAGLAVLELIRIVGSHPEPHYTVVNPLSVKPVSCGPALDPNADCFICGRRRVYLELDVSKTLLSQFIEILQQGLGLLEPQVSTGDEILVETGLDADADLLELREKTLAELNVGNDTELLVDDFLQNIEDLTIVLRNRPMTEEQPYRIVESEETVENDENVELIE